MGSREEALMLFEKMRDNLIEARNHLDEVVLKLHQLNSADVKRIEEKAEVLWLSTIQIVKDLQPEFSQALLEAAGFETTPPYKRKLQS